MAAVAAAEDKANGDIEEVSRRTPTLTECINIRRYSRCSRLVMVYGSLRSFCGRLRSGACPSVFHDCIFLDILFSCGDA